jgi:hypothetical protein
VRNLSEPRTVFDANEDSPPKIKLETSGAAGGSKSPQSPEAGVSPRMLRGDKSELPGMQKLLPAIDPPHKQRGGAPVIELVHRSLNLSNDE